MATPDWSWQAAARCSGEDTYLFFGLDGERGEAKDRRERRAKAICAGCPVRRECLDYALSRPERYGLWSGLNEDERHAERRRRMRYTASHSEPVPEPTVAEKVCRGCDELLPAGDFPRDQRSSDGLHSRCKGCANEAGRQRRIEAKQAVAS